MRYGKAIRICRAAKGLSQKQLAARASIGSSHVSLIEAGKRSPSLATVEKLCKALSVPAHLVMLLAAEPGDVQAKHMENLKDLSGMILQLLVGPESRKKEKDERRHHSS
jgi:transcriptional regulator with XRE-family HTH domain